MSGAERWDMCLRPFGAGAGRIDTGPATALHVLDGARPAIPLCTPRARLFLAVTIRRWTRRDTAHVFSDHGPSRADVSSSGTLACLAPSRHGSPDKTSTPVSIMFLFACFMGLVVPFPIRVPPPGGLVSAVPAPLLFCHRGCTRTQTGPQSASRR